MACSKRVVGIADAEQVHVGARVDDEWHASGVGGRARGANAIDGDVQIVERMSTVVNLVFEVDADGAGVDHSANGFGEVASVMRKAGFDVGSDGNRHDASDTRDRGDHLVARHRLAVGIAD